MVAGAGFVAGCLAAGGVRKSSGDSARLSDTAASNCALAVRLNTTRLDRTASLSEVAGVAATSAFLGAARVVIAEGVLKRFAEAARKKKDTKRLVFQAGDVLKRVEEHGDLFADVLTLKQKLRKS